MHGLAHAASGYQRVLEENHKLYNQVQDLKGITCHWCKVWFKGLSSWFNSYHKLLGNIRVYCRVRPFLRGQNCFSIVDHIEEGNITIITPSKYGKEGRKSFNFNKVFGPMATQGM